jgi:alpha-L-fucosidase
MKALKIFAVIYLILLSTHSLFAQTVKPPAPYGPVPSERQLAWHQMEFYGFIHYTVNAFTDREWGNGDEDPAVFNPTELNVKQWAKTAKEAGMKGLILTAKHHDGFCLWPSKYTEHSIKNIKVKNRNIVKELAAACKEYGLKFGVYLSPWDRNNAMYGKPEYVEYYKKQLKELLTENGKIFEVWFDGANGGDGYYGGAREKRTIDAKTYYQWDVIHNIVRTLQPKAMMFSDGGPDCRWVGNESGEAGITNWCTINPERFYPGSPNYKELTEGHRNGSAWIPSETDVSIRPGWFYHEKEDSKVKSPEKLVELYYSSVGRGSNLLLNLPPDKRGLINEADIKSLREMRKILNETFRVNYAKGAKAEASNVRGKSRQFAASNVVKGKTGAYWATDDRVKTPELILTLKKEATFNRVRIKEFIKLGQRIEAFAVDYWKEGKWEPLAEGTSIGYQRILCTKEVKTNKVRLRILNSPVCVAISDFGLFLQK